MGQVTEGRRVLALVLRSSRQETTFAIVSVRRSEQVQAARQLVHSLCEAVTAWARDTQDGQQAYEETASDYNVGDLANDIDEPTLTPFLAAQGLFDVEIDVYSDEDFQDNWTFDTHLVDAGRLTR